MLHAGPPVGGPFWHAGRQLEAPPCGGAGCCCPRRRRQAFHYSRGPRGAPRGVEGDVVVGRGRTRRAEEMEGRRRRGRDDPPHRRRDFASSRLIWPRRLLLNPPAPAVVEGVGNDGDDHLRAGDIDPGTARRRQPSPPRRPRERGAGRCAGGRAVPCHSAPTSPRRTAPQCPAILAQRRGRRGGGLSPEGARQGRRHPALLLLHCGTSWAAGRGGRNPTAGRRLRRRREGERSGQERRRCEWWLLRRKLATSQG
jgi:hypothetical protein